LPVGSIRKRQILTGLLLQLIEPGSEESKTACGSNVDASSSVISLCILAEGYRTTTRDKRAILRIDHFTFYLIEFWIECNKTEDAIL
jgi:hypothetical protein